MVICRLEQVDSTFKDSTLCAHQDGLTFKTYVAIVGSWILCGENNKQLHNISKV
jgi:hypothetical protein